MCTSLHPRIWIRLEVRRGAFCIYDEVLGGAHLHAPERTSTREGPRKHFTEYMVSFVESYGDIKADVLVNGILVN